MANRVRRGDGRAVIVLLVTTAVASVSLIWVAATSSRVPRAAADVPAIILPERQIRHQLFAELRPIALANCELERFGEQNDGGYVMCGNLLSGAHAAYSYGISGYDGWGCDMAARLSSTTHQYDCFDQRAPACTKGRTIFHPLCIAAAARVDDAKRIFQPLEQQIQENGDAGRRIIVKMDVEGAEWESLLATPDHILQNIDQLAVELHGVDEQQYLDVVRKIKRMFHVAHVHANNQTCSEDAAPFPSTVYEVLFVNKRVGQVNAHGVLPRLPHALDRPNVPWRPDCPPKWD